MNKVKLLSVAAIILLLSNLVLVVFILKNKPGRGDGPKDYIIEKLNFDAKQIEDYKDLIEVHRSEIRENEKEIHALKSTLYAGLNTIDQSIKDSLMNQIAAIQVRIENTHCKHFKDIQSLCKPEQIKAFDALLLDMSDLFSPHRKPQN
jgi:protein CpxP